MIEESKLINEYVERESWRVKANANWNYSMSGLKFHLASTCLAKDAITKFGKYGKMHSEGKLYLHNLDGGIYQPYCNGNDLLKLLQLGLKNPVGMSSRPAKHFNTALNHITNMCYLMTHEFNGAQAFRDIDILLAPYIWKDGLTQEKVNQEIQMFLWNVSFPLRAGFQSIFLNLTFGLRPSKYYDDMPVWIGGDDIKTIDLKKNEYKDFQDEIDMINKAFLINLLEGDKGLPFTFPLPTYNITKDFKWNSEIADLIFELASVWGSPYFANYVGVSDINEEDALSMCCRLRISLNEVQKVTGGIWNFGNNTGSLAVCTINLSQLGYIAKNDIHFFKLLDKRIEDAVGYLQVKKQYIKEGMNKGLFPISVFYIGDLLYKTYFLTVGISGLNECCLNLHGLHIVNDVDFAENVLKYINLHVLEWQKKTGELINFEATPAEGASYHLAKLDKEKFDECYVQGYDDKIYYTGSSLIPANFGIDLVSAIRHQERLQRWYTGGSVFHIEHGEYASPESIKFLIKKICENTSLPYITWSPPITVCTVHGKHVGKKCCDEGIELSRVVGYYRPVSNWNVGKAQEFRDKKFYNDDLYNIF